MDATIDITKNAPGMVGVDTVTKGQIIYHRCKRNADGTPKRFKVKSVRTWKRDPNRYSIGLKRGLYEWVKLTEEDSYEIRQYTTDPTKVLPAPWRAGCGGDEIIDHEDKLYVFNPVTSERCVFNFRTMEIEDYK